MGNLPRSIAGIAYAALAALMLSMPCGASATPGEVAVGETVPDGVLDGLNGPTRRLGDFRGRPILINLWASWCGPCVEEMASIERLAWHDGRPGFTIIGISTDDYRDRAVAQLRRSHATISHFIDDSQKWENLLGASSIPLTVLVDGRGRVLAKFHGARDWDSPASIALILQAMRSP
jgi:thiol-disulfide isomerase/thioredoxin